jgi:hypothetical protein
MIQRLIDLPGMADLERAALMRTSYADADARSRHPEIDACSMNLFGLTADEADATPRPPGWDGVERRALREQVTAFDQAGWDVTHQGRPLRTLAHFNVQLWLAIRGVAGRLPAKGAAAEDDEEGQAHAWGASLQAGAARFRRDRR